MMLLMTMVMLVMVVMMVMMTMKMKMIMMTRDELPQYPHDVILAFVLHLWRN